MYAFLKDEIEVYKNSCELTKFFKIYSWNYIPNLHIVTDLVLIQFHRKIIQKG